LLLRAFFSPVISSSGSVLRLLTRKGGYPSSVCIVPFVKYNGISEMSSLVSVVLREQFQI
jgi:hypothetical protein